MNGWGTKRLHDVGTVFDGPHATPKTVDAGPIFLGISALQDGQINLSETRHVTEDDYKQWTRRVVPKSGDVVFSYETRLGHAAVIPDGLECCLGRRMGLVRFKAGIIEPQFFLYQYLSPSFQEFLGSRTIRGATVDRISIKDFPTFPIAVPPLPEQQRIVAILDEAFEGIAIAKANAEKNLQNSKELFKSHLHTLFANPANEWSRKSLLDLCNPNRGITYGVIKLGAEVPSGTPCLRTSNVRWLRIETEGMKRISAGDDATVRLRSSWLPTRVVPGQRARDHLALVYGLKGCGKRPPFPMT